MPVSDINAAREFYEGLLGLRLSQDMGGEWLEYDIGGTTFAISTADTDHPVPVRGAVFAFEVSDLDAEVARLQGAGARFRGTIIDITVPLRHSPGSRRQRGDYP
jgi:catechol 2,3-dioxygenase-like lactoylglutathione lyase family enzyme